MFFLRLVLQVFTKKSDFQIYTESRFDPLIRDRNSVSSNRANYIKSMAGYFRDHELEDEDQNIVRFGDISIITLNMYRSVLSEQETIQSANNVRIILDEAHPTFLCLQGVDDSLLKRIASRMKDNKHYGLSVFDKYDIDMLNGQRNYFPIIYDQSIAKIVNSGYFDSDPRKSSRYGSFIEIKDKRKPDSLNFTVVNVDIYSSFNDVVSAEFSNIVSDINSFKEVEQKPVLFVGTLGTVPNNVADLIETTFKNTIDGDSNNINIPKTTLHSGDQEDHIQRDFILLRDLKNEFTLNYARILRDFLASDHYPVHAIFSYTQQFKGKKEIKGSDQCPGIAKNASQQKK